MAPILAFVLTLGVGFTDPFRAVEKFVAIDCCIEKKEVYPHRMDDPYLLTV